MPNEFAGALVAVAIAVAQSGPAAADLKGSVQDPQGRFISGAVVDLQCGGVRRRVRTDAEGRFALDGLPTERCRATVSAPDFESATTPVDLTSGIGTLEQTLRLRTFATEVTVTPTPGVSETPFTVPESMSITTRAEMDARPYALLPQVLREEPGILLQQTTTAQVSPIIRGFTGQSNVYLVDGVRFNTAAWRSGPSQYLSWMEGAVVDRFEVVKGAGSVQYGSDALGGSINVLTESSILLDRGTQVSGSFDAGFGSAEQSAAGGAEIQLQTARAGFRGGFTGKHIGDLRTGSDDDSHAAITRFVGLPSTTMYERLPETAYQQSGGYVLGSGRIGDGTLRGMYTHTDLDDSSRYDRIFGGDGLYRSGFDPQTLDFAYVKYDATRMAGLDGLSATFSVNRQADGRYEQARPTARIDAQQATTMVFGYQAQAHRLFGPHRISTGVEYYDESTSAERTLTDVLTNAVTPSRPDIPDGTTYSTFGAFVQGAAALFNDRVEVRGGLRYGRFAFATRADAALGLSAEEVASDAVTFQTGAVVRITNQLNATFAASRGFRAPNSSDLGAIGLTGGGGFEITPSRAAALGGLVGSTAATGAISTGEEVPLLGPEVLYSYEAGLKFSVDRLDAAVAVYDLELYDTIQRRAIVFPSGIVGTVISGHEIVRQDATGLGYIAADVRPVATRVNLDQARIRGMEAQGHLRLAHGLSTGAYFSMSNGRLLSTDEFLRRMPPAMGGADLRWTRGSFWLGGVLSFAREQTRLNAGDLGDARIGGLRTRASIGTYFNGTATDLGLVANGVLLETGETLTQVQNRVLGTQASAPLFTTGPGFVTVGVRAGWQVTSHLGLTLIGENLTDRNYRLYGSGADAAGINVIGRIRYRF